MPAYAYKTRVNYGKETIWTNKEKSLESSNLSIAILQKIVGDSYFSVENECNGCVITWSESKLETDKQQKTRIVRLEKYNAEVERRKSERSKENNPND